MTTAVLNSNCRSSVIQVSSRGIPCRGNLVIQISSRGIPCRGKNYAMPLPLGKNAEGHFRIYLARTPTIINGNTFWGFSQPWQLKQILFPCYFTGYLSRTGLCPNPATNGYIRDNRLNLDGMAVIRKSDPPVPSCEESECSEDNHCEGNKKCCKNRCGGSVCTPSGKPKFKPRNHYFQ